MFCPFSHAVQFFPCGWVPNTFENMVASNTAVDLESLHSQFWRASVRHVLIKAKSATITSQHENCKSPNLNFANVKIQPFLAISPNLMPAKFSRYTVVFCASAGKSSRDRNSGDWFQKGYGALASGWPSSDSS